MRLAVTLLLCIACGNADAAPSPPQSQPMVGLEELLPGFQVIVPLYADPEAPAIASPATIKGRVLLDGVPVPHFGVLVTEYPDADYDIPLAVRSADGRFAATGLAPKKTGLAIMGPGFARHVIEGVLPLAGKTLDLGDVHVSRGRRAEGRVLDERGAPVAGALVAVFVHRYLQAPYDPLRSMLAGYRAVRSDALGHYVIDGISNGEILMIGAARGDDVSAQRDVPDAGDANLDFVLARAGSIVGQIDDFAAYRASGSFSVAVDNDRARTPFYLEIGPDGRFAMARVPPGDYKVYGPLLPLPSITATIAPGRAAPIQMAMSKTPVHVTVRPSVACSTVSLRSPDRVAYAACKGAGDDIGLEHVTPGPYALCVDAACKDIVVTAAPYQQLAP